jgi:hypothetical protein
VTAKTAEIYWSGWLKRTFDDGRTEYHNLQFLSSVLFNSDGTAVLEFVNLEMPIEVDAETAVDLRGYIHGRAK